MADGSQRTPGAGETIGTVDVAGTKYGVDVPLSTTVAVMSTSASAYVNGDAVGTTLAPAVFTVAGGSLTLATIGISVDENVAPDIDLILMSDDPVTAGDPAPVDSAPWAATGNSFFVTVDVIPFRSADFGTFNGATHMAMKYLNRRYTVSGSGIGRLFIVPIARGSFSLTGSGTVAVVQTGCRS